jgi:hypothetical protein
MAVGMAVFGALGIALISAALYPPVRPWLRDRHPARRVEILTGWLVFPASLAVTLCAVGLCRGDVVTLGPVLWMGLASLVLLAAASILWTGWRILRIRTTLRALVGTARHDGVLGVDVVESPYPFSFATAVAGGRVVLSSALCAGTSPEILAIVLRHERAHLTQRHPQLRLIGALLSVAHLPAVRRRLMEDLALACEEVCDELSVGDDRDRAAVATALLGVARRYRGRPLPSALPMMAFHGSHLQDRVESLLATYPAFPPRPAGSCWRWASARGALNLVFWAWSFWQVGVTSLRLVAE